MYPANKKKIDIDIPKLGDFIHSAYINFARKLYKNIYLFEKDIMPLDYQKNMRECEILCRESILEVIRESMPIEHILRAYMDKTTHEEIIEETLEKQVTEGEAVDMLEEAKKNMEDKEEESSGVNINKVDKVDNDNEVVVEEPTLVSNKDIEESSEKISPEAKLEKATLTESETNKEKIDENVTNDLQKDVSIAKAAIKELEKAVETQKEEFKPNMDTVKKEVINEISKKKTLISFNDNDSVLDMGTNSETIISAPKTTERLEKISRDANDKRKAEEEEDDDDFYDDDGPLNIIGENISLDINDFDDLNKNKSKEPEIILNDIEVLA